MGSQADIVRREFGASDKKRDAGLTTPDTIERFDNIQYGEDPVWNILDVYRPKDKKGCKLPVIVSVHGGGWVYGDKEVYQFYCMSLAEHGFAVVNYTYRLAPENKYPKSIEDTNDVFEWVLRHSEEYDFNTDYIFGVGDSAGAHMLGLYSAICTNDDCAKLYAFKVPNGFKPTAIALNCGKYSMNDEMKNDKMTSSLVNEYLPNGGTDEEYKLIDVVRYITEDYVPVFYMTCTGDFLEKQAPLLGAKLIEKHIPHEFHYYGDSKNVLGHVFHCNVRLDDAKKCNKDECDYFKKFIKED